MSTTTKPIDSAQEQTTPPPTTPTASSPKPVSRHLSASSGKGKAPEQPHTSLSRSISRGQSRHPTPRSPGKAHEPDDAAWGSNFWVTLVDPQTQTSFYACPATGQVSWDPPVGHFVLPPSTEGEWWELSDESRGGIPYYYQTKTGETVWDRPEGFVIPLGIVQNTALGRRLSQAKFDRFSQSIPSALAQDDQQIDGPSGDKTINRRSHTSTPNHSSPDRLRIRQTQSSRSASTGSAKRAVVRRSISGDQLNGGLRPIISPQLTPIPGSPYTTEHSTPPSPVPHHSILQNSPKPPSGTNKDSPNSKARPNGDVHFSDSVSRARGLSYTPHRSPQPQSLSAAVEMLANLDFDRTSLNKGSPTDTSFASNSSYRPVPSIDVQSDSSSGKSHREMPTSPPRHAHAKYNGSGPSKIAAKGISAPMPNHAATMELCPVKNRAIGQPIPVEYVRPVPAGASTTTLSTGTYRMLPPDLQMDIQQFSESEYARLYFSTHRSGFIFRRRVPVAQLMTWQKAPLTSPLLTLNRSLGKDAVRIFKVIQRIMGDREREKSIGVRLQPDTRISMVPHLNASSTSLTPSSFGVLEEERWLIGEGLVHGELRDEICCQLMKQLTGNPNPESVFKGWQFLCVLLTSFPPSKNFETYLQAFIQKHTTQQEGRIDVIAKYCLRRLASIAKKGPRGKPPTIAEIETASDAAFNPSTFGESLDAIIRLQERNYPHNKVPIILPFLADGILALGGLRSEGIFRVPGDVDSVSELKLRIDRGYYTLDNVDDPFVLASLMKLWLRELCDPLVPDEMYNECTMNSNNPEACIRLIERLPTINRRVVLFVISFLQLFLEDKTQTITKMTPANLALVMAPNLLRCSSDSISVVFTNAQFEQLFVYNLLLHLRCDEIDPHYKPTHGLGAIPENPPPKSFKARDRRR